MLRVLLLAVAALWVTSAQAHAPGALDGRMLFVKEGDLWVLDASGPRQLATGGTFSQPTWAPDGASLAYVYRGTNFADIFVTDDQGQTQRRLTASQSTILDYNDWNLRPTWSPDGKLIAFVSDKTTSLPNLSVMNAADGSARRTVPTPGLQQEAVDALAWSPDGSQLAITLFNEPGPTQIALVPLGTPQGRQPSRVLTNVPGGALDPAWSPDGTWLAFAGHDGFATEISIVRPDGTGLTRLTADGQFNRAPAWSPNGRQLAYLSNKGGYFEVWVADLNVDSNGAVTASNARRLTDDLRLGQTRAS